MRFHSRFLRDKGGGTNPVLGSDVAPMLPPSPNADNVLSAHVKTSWGDSVGRIAVAYKPPSGLLALDATLWIWDGLTESWYQLEGGGAGVIKANAISSFDCLAIMDRVIRPSEQQQVNHASGFDIALVVTDPGAAPAGTHIFALAAICNRRNV